ncbi:MAG: hypothetical protein JWR04_2704 [Rhodoglobus sp.]|jgi:hypothetical protein|nr:hypothetical protein [Rhodoglobus sp.]
MLEAWWNDIVKWFSSYDGRVTIGAVVPVIAILVAGVVATLIARGSIKRLIAQQDREHKASAIAALIASGRRAAGWNTLSAAEKDHVDHQTSEAEVRVRLLPVAGAGLAADWAAHQLATMKANSANYSFQAEQDLADFQDGLIAWQAKPARARKLFAQDLAAWKYEAAAPPVDDLASKQQAWNAAQHSDDKAATTTVLPTA